MGLFNFLKSKAQKEKEVFMLKMQNQVFPDGDEQKNKVIKDVQELLNMQYSLVEVKNTYIQAASLYLNSTDKSQNNIVISILQQENCVLKNEDALKIYNYLVGKYQPRKVSKARAPKKVANTAKTIDDTHRIIKSDYLAKSKVFPQKILKYDTLATLKKMLKNPDTDDLYKQLISKLLIPFKISIFKYNLNKDYFINPYPIDHGENYNYIAPSLKYIKDNKSSAYQTGYPNWFYLAFPDVALWLILGDGRDVVIRELGNYIDPHLLDEDKRFELLKGYVDLYLKESEYNLECEIY